MFLPIPQQSWTGGSIQPIVYISTAGEAAGLTEDDITKEYGENITGTGTVTITGIRKYTGKVTLEFNIFKPDLFLIGTFNEFSETSGLLQFEEQQDGTFKGVNVVVVTRTDGSTQTTKAVF